MSCTDVETAIHLKDSNPHTAYRRVLLLVFLAYGKDPVAGRVNHLTYSIDSLFLQADLMLQCNHVQVLFTLLDWRPHFKV